MAHPSGPSGRVPFVETVPAPFSTFVGRDAEVDRVIAELTGSATRLIVLSGTGGVGKTRLATEVAHRLIAMGGASPFPDGIAFVSLMGVTDPEMVLPAVASTLGVTVVADPLTSFTLALQDHRLLLILDNMEQVIDAAPVVVSLLRGIPSVTILVTSRRLLRVAGEVVVAVGPLALPDADARWSLEAVRETPAVRLFLQRAGATGADLSRLDDRDAAALAEICQRLDGLPLAIELAAARTTVLTPQQLLARLDDRLTMLTRGGADLPARHQALRSAIDWSFDLLTPDQRAWMSRLSVFRDGFTLDLASRAMAAEGVAAIVTGHPDAAALTALAAEWRAGGADGLAVLEDLVGQSLIGVTPSETEDRRFSMLETVRAYSADRISASLELELIRAAHAAVFFAICREIPTAMPERRERWIRQVGEEYDNVRAALEWLLTSGSAQHGVEMASALWRFWDARGLIGEGVDWLERALGRPGAVQPRTRALALNNLANLYSDQSRLELARDLYAESLAIIREHGSQVDIADVLNNTGLMAMWLGDQRGADRIFRETIDLRRDGDDRYGESVALLNAADNALQAGAIAEGTAYYERAADRRGAFDDPRGKAWLMFVQGRIAFHTGDAAAVDLFQRCLAVFDAFGDETAAASVRLALSRCLLASGDMVGAADAVGRSLQTFNVASDRRRMAATLEVVAAIAAGTGDALRAARLLGAAAAERQTMHVPLSRLLFPWHLGLTSTVRTTLGEQTFRDAYQHGFGAGAIGSIADAELGIEAALAPPEARPATIAAGPPGRGADAHAVVSSLTQREIEVLQQVARGLGDREIGYALGIGRRTVSTHVASLLTKLAVPSRAAAAAMAVRLGLA